MTWLVLAGIVGYIAAGIATMYLVLDVIQEAHGIEAFVAVALTLLFWPLILGAYIVGCLDRYHRTRRRWPPD